MNKAHRCLLHLACIVRKTIQGRDVAWHWQHLVREFGLGELADRPGESRPMETRQCSI